MWHQNKNVSNDEMTIVPCHMTGFRHKQRDSKARESKTIHFLFYFIQEIFLLDNRSNLSRIIINFSAIFAFFLLPPCVARFWLKIVCYLFIYLSYNNNFYLLLSWWLVILENS